jgi:hypothetical protein
VIFHVRYELVNHDLAVALADLGERRGGTTEQITNWVRSRRKKEIREIAQRHLERHGDPKGWRENEEEPVYEAARQTVQKHWPKGA